MTGVKTEGSTPWATTGQKDKSEPTRAGTPHGEAACFGRRGGKVLPLFLPFMTSLRISLRVVPSGLLSSVETMKANSRGGGIVGE